MNKENLKDKREEMKGKLSAKRKIIAPIVIILIIVIAGIGIRGSSGHLKGEFEAVIVPHVSEVSGKLTNVYVGLGQPVKTGDVLAEIDSATQKYTVEQLEISLEQQMLALGEAQGGSGSSSGNALLSAQAAYNSAAAAAAQAQHNYETALTLYNEGVIPKTELDSAQLAATTAANTAASARAQLDSAGSEYSAENADLSVSKVQSQLEQAREQLDKYTIRATVDGVVTSNSYTAGNIVAPGYDIVDVAADSEHYLVAYLPVKLLGDYDYDQTLTVKYGGSSYEGVIKYIDVNTGYTPKDLQTAANKSRKSVKIKLLLPEECEIKAGETAKIML